MARGGDRPLRGRRSHRGAGDAHGRRHVLQPSRAQDGAGRRGHAGLQRRAQRAGLGPGRDAAAHRPAGPHPLPQAAQPRLHAGARARPDAAHRGDRPRPHRPLRAGRALRVRPGVRAPDAGHPHRRAARPRSVRLPAVPAVGRRHAVAGPAEDDRRGGRRRGRGGAGGPAVPRRRVRAPPGAPERRPDLVARARPRRRRGAVHDPRAAGPHAPAHHRRVRDHDRRPGRGDAAPRPPSRPGRAAPGRPRPREELRRGDPALRQPRAGAVAQRGVPGPRRWRRHPGRLVGDGALRRRQPRSSCLRRAGSLRRDAGRRQEPRRLRLRQPLLRRCRPGPPGDAELVHDAARSAAGHRARRAAAGPRPRAELLPPADEAPAPTVPRRRRRRPIIGAG